MLDSRAHPLVNDEGDQDRADQDRLERQERLEFHGDAYGTRLASGQDPDAAPVLVTRSEA